VDAANADSAPGERPSVADGTLRPLDPRYVNLQQQTGWIAAAVMAVIATTALLLHLAANRADARRGIVSSAAR